MQIEQIQTASVANSFGAIIASSYHMNAFIHIKSTVIGSKC